jgi:hypothetical protein
VVLRAPRVVPLSICSRWQGWSDRQWYRFILLPRVASPPLRSRWRSSSDVSDIVSA